MLGWHIITGEYPPEGGGVADYTRLIARGLASAGDEVSVWAPGHHKAKIDDQGVRVHGLPGHFGPRTLQVLDHALRAARGDRILVQYVPHAFGFKAMNLPFCVWLLGLARRRSRIFIMFHEIEFPRIPSQRLRHRLLWAVTSVMATLAARAAERIFVTCAAWEGLLRSKIPHGRRITCLPVPSTVPVVREADMHAIKAQYAGKDRFLIGHFGTYDRGICDYLEPVMPRLLSDRRAALLLLGRGSTAFREALIKRQPRAVGRVFAPEVGSVRDLSLHLSACDVMVQPYPDGITTRRTTAMAVLSHGRPMVTTKGVLTESLWSEAEAVAIAPGRDFCGLYRTIACLLDNGAERERLGRRGKALYQEHFELRHTIVGLREF